MDGIQKVEEYLSRQTEALKTQIRTLRLRGGLSSLPDEVLAIVLKYATTASAPFDDDEGRSATLFTKASIKLSHVCQRFRFLMMQISSFWSCIFNGMKYGLVSALCKRMAMPTAEIILEETKRRSRTNTELFILTVRPRSERWRRFIHGKRSNFPSTDATGKDDKELEVLARLTRQLHAPFLAEYYRLPQGKYTPGIAQPRCL